jgi:hypothetical protein
MKPFIDEAIEVDGMRNMYQVWAFIGNSFQVSNVSNVDCRTVRYKGDNSTGTKN